MAMIQNVERDNGFAPRMRSNPRAANSGDPLRLARSERWFLEQVRRHGTTRLVVSITFIVIVNSLAVASVVIAPLSGFERAKFGIPVVLLVTLVVAFSAPAALVYTIRLVSQLDVTSTLLHQSSVTDPLTGIRNRRGFFDTFASAGGDGDVDVAMLDLDHFKALNDRHGHDFGDRALRTVANWLQVIVGDDGIVGRLGGDEFAFVAGVGSVGGLGTRHRMELEGIEFEATVGRVRCRAGEDREMALLAADAELYRHKNAREDPAPAIEVRR
ncbi:GGDEF domain-containing protein [Nodularia spumigena]|uniref:GGDEF domain-containing protein n=1 Tax=Nodularia spumigena TaxID=70799 RepID=UPI002B204EB0|nr:GGDEF domain-containing protein [Nodularia spumigena]MEA5558032.1 GGDEF domain-containing protein [Nodularia spumigena CH309]